MLSNNSKSVSPLNHLHPFGCRLYVLDHRLQQIQKIGKWKQRSRIGPERIQGTGNSDSVTNEDLPSDTQHETLHNEGDTEEYTTEMRASYIGHVNDPRNCGAMPTFAETGRQMWLTLTD